MRGSLKIWLVGLLILGAARLMAQSPMGINYQGIARSADGSPLVNQAIGLRVTITSGADGTIDYREEHHPTTNEFGLFAVIVGQGQSSGSIADVAWANGNKWLQIEIDPKDKGNYLLVGTQQMMSVPYALFAGKSGDRFTPGFGIDISNGKVNNILPDQIVNLTGTGGVTVTGSYPNFTIDAANSTNDADADPTNELQSISKSGNTVTLSGSGGSFTDEINDADADPANELLQTATLAGSNLELTDAGGTKSVDLSSLQDGTGSDNQTLTGTVLTTDTRDLAISGGNNITLDVADNDNDSSNELQTIVKSGSTVTLSNGGGSFTDAVNDADADPNNELQALSKSGSTVTLSNGGGSFTDAVNDADSNPANELITNGSYIANNTLRLTDAGGNTDVGLGTLNANLNANANRLTNVADPVNPGDAINLGYFETKVATDYAMSIPLTYTSLGAGDVALDLSGFTLDKGGLITGSSITISEAGVYAVSVQGISALAAGSDIEITINGVPTPVIKGLNHYMGLYLFDLLPGDQIRIVVKFTSVETVNLQIAAYKI
jgi:hypothetical protein